MSTIGKKRKRSSSHLRRNHERIQKLEGLQGEEMGDGAFGYVFTIIGHPGKAMKVVSFRSPDDEVDHGAMVSFTIECSIALKMMKSQIPGVVSNPWEPEVTYDEYGVPLRGYLFMSREECDLSHRVHRMGRLNYLEINIVLEQCLNTLVSLEKEEIAHFDIKPKNILVSGSGEGIISHVCDFGLGHLVIGPTILDKIVTTRWYRPPDAYNTGQAINPYKVDIYALGATILELVCDHPLSEEVFIHYGKRVRMKRHEECADLYYKNVLLTETNLPIVLNRMMEECVLQASEDSEKGHLRMIFDLLMKMMSFDPNDRPTAEKALMYPIFKTDINESPKGVNEL